MPKFTGLSLSLCIADILRGLVPELDVDFMLIGTTNDDDEAWLKKMDFCKKNYWQEWPEEAALVAHRLRESGRIKAIDECQFWGVHSVVDGHWLTEKGTQCHTGQLHDVQYEEERNWIADQSHCD